VSSKKPENPLEALVVDGSDIYVQLVHELAKELAPFRPWWSADLSPDEEVWRYEENRPAIIGWLTEAGAAMGWESWDETLKKLEELFMSPAVPDFLSMELIVDERADIIREMVQAAGPHEAAKHIRKLEKMVEGRQDALRRLRIEAMDIPETPPPLPVEALPNTSGWPLFGGYADVAETPPAFQPPV